MPRRRRGNSGWVLAVFLVLVVLPVLVGLGVYVFVDPNDFKPRIAESVRAATGRDIALDGSIRIGFSATPTLQAERVRLSNPPGFSRPDMATLAKVEAQLALWPLLRGRLEIVRLTLTEPELLLETDANGQSNWRLAPMAKAAQPSAPSGTAEPPHPSVPRFAVGDVRIVNGRLTWRDMRSNQSRVADIRRFSATSSGKLAPVSASADLLVEGHEVAVSAETGPMERLLGGEAMAPGWPLQIVARVEGVRLAASGAMERPLEGRGYQLTLDATAPDLALLSKALGRALPALHDVSASAKLSDASGAPLASALVLRAGASDLGALVPRLGLERLEVTASALDQPVHAEFDAALADTKFHGIAAMSLPTGLDFTAGARLPVEASLQVAGALVSTKGSLVLPASVELSVAARVPDLAALQDLAGYSLPSLHNLAIEANIIGHDGDVVNGLTLRNLKITGAQGDIAGELTVAFKPRLAVQAQLTSPMLDFDVIRADLAAPVTVARTSTSSASPTPPPPAAPSMSPQPFPAPGGPKRVFSDRMFDLSALAGFDADLRFTLAQLRAAGVVYRDIAGRIELAQGRLALDPFAGVSPGGRVEGRASLDSRPAEPPIILALTAPGLALKPLLTAFGLPDDVTGNVDLAADLTAAGNSPHAIAASLSGRFGLAMTEGEIDNRLLSALVDMLRVAKMPAELFGATGSRTKLRCFATRLDAQRGVTAVSAFVLDTGRALVQGGGIVNLGDEILGLRLRPLWRSGGGGVVLPVRVAGPMRQPNVALDSGGALEGIAGNLAGNIAGLSRNPLAALGQALAGERGGDACGPAVALARAARPNLK